MKRSLMMSTVSVACLSVLSACAKSTNEIPTQYVSPMQYNSYTCKQLEGELNMVSRRASELGGRVDKTASDDSAQMAVGLILFWPTLFFLDGNTPEAAEYGRLKGEFEAMEKAAIQKDCSIQVAAIAPKKPVQEAKNEDEEAYPSTSKSRR